MWLSTIVCLGLSVCMCYFVHMSMFVFVFVFVVVVKSVFVHTVLHLCHTVCLVLFCACEIVFVYTLVCLCLSACKYSCLPMSLCLYILLCG